MTARIKINFHGILHEQSLILNYNFQMEVGECDK
jgi:hypothetical protein